MFLADAVIRYLVTQHIPASNRLYHKEPSHNSDLNVEFSLQQKKKEKKKGSNNKFKFRGQYIK